ncbi:hypothetical protein GCM10027277_47470 [Pseudoduganella ginsengisoli]|uniref:DUF2092 domain-containing protein n=1 Tax=Pseudoduganella ginsengisoli TaxID=1462440 RepID=A0A6L6Q386_9BURK|nr:hypothetical protein [Pseudoduganella ginsengisoli]MTW04065.1 hypothetical protein [Pseudoduganella ginsengisoli]
MRVMYAALLGAMLAAPLGMARADGLADLKSALQRLQASTPLKGVLKTETSRKVGEGADADEYAGSAAVHVEDGAQGLRLQYGRDLLARMDADRLAAAKNPNAKTPSLYALKEMGPDDLRPMVSGAENLVRNIERAAFKAEKAGEWQGKPARQLTFTVPVKVLSDRERKYMKEFDGAFDVWIAPDGTPLGSQLNWHMQGRAYVVVSFDIRQEERSTYMLSGDRLVTTRMESRLSNSGAGEKSEVRTVKTLQAG